jgi:hypothetical protein
VEASTCYSERSAKADVKPKGKSNKNVFATLESDSEKEEVVDKPVKEEFPQLATGVVNRSQSVALNYAAALSKPVVTNNVKIESVVAKSEYKVAPWDSSAPKASRIKSWADCIDSDDDEDDDEEDDEETYQSPKLNSVVDDDW